MISIDFYEQARHVRGPQANFTFSSRSSNGFLDQEESRIYTVNQLEKRGPQRNSAPLRFHLNRVGNGNDDSSSEIRFEEVLIYY